MSQQLMNLVEKPYLKDSPPEFHVGDTVNVQCRIVEGEKERIQIFNGIVIAHQGRGINESFTVRRIGGNEGVERKYLVHSPGGVGVKVRRRRRGRRAQRYDPRQRIGKARKLRELRIHQKKAAEPAELATAAV